MRGRPMPFYMSEKHSGLPLALTEEGDPIEGFVWFHGQLHPVGFSAAKHPPALDSALDWIHPLGDPDSVVPGILIADSVPHYLLADGEFYPIACGDNGRPLEGFLRHPQHDDVLVPVGLQVNDAQGEPVPGLIQLANGEETTGVPAHPSAGWSTHYLTAGEGAQPVAPADEDRLSDHQPADLGADIGLQQPIVHRLDQQPSGEAFPTFSGEFGTFPGRFEGVPFEGEAPPYSAEISAAQTALLRTDGYGTAQHSMPQPVQPRPGQDQATTHRPFDQLRAEIMPTPLPTGTPMTILSRSARPPDQPTASQTVNQTPGQSASQQRAHQADQYKNQLMYNQPVNTQSTYSHPTIYCQPPTHNARQTLMVPGSALMAPSRMSPSPMAPSPMPTGMMSMMAPSSATPVSAVASPVEVAFGDRRWAAEAYPGRSVSVQHTRAPSSMVDQRSQAGQIVAVHRVAPPSNSGLLISSPLAGAAMPNSRSGGTAFSQPLSGSALHRPQSGATMPQSTQGQLGAAMPQAPRLEVYRPTMSFTRSPIAMSSPMNGRVVPAGLKPGTQTRPTEGFLAPPTQARQSAASFSLHPTNLPPVGLRASVNPTRPNLPPPQQSSANSLTSDPLPTGLTTHVSSHVGLPRNSELERSLSINSPGRMVRSPLAQEYQMAKNNAGNPTHLQAPSGVQRMGAPTPLPSTTTTTRKISAMAPNFSSSTTRIIQGQAVGLTGANSAGHSVLPDNVNRASQSGDQSHPSRALMPSSSAPQVGGSNQLQVPQQRMHVPGHVSTLFPGGSEPVAKQSGPEARTNARLPLGVSHPGGSLSGPQPAATPVVQRPHMQSNAQPGRSSAPPRQLASERLIPPEAQTPNPVPAKLNVQMKRPAQTPETGASPLRSEVGGRRPSSSVRSGRMNSGARARVGGPRAAKKPNGIWSIFSLCNRVESQKQDGSSSTTSSSCSSSCDTSRLDAYNSYTTVSDEQVSESLHRARPHRRVC